MMHTSGTSFRRHPPVRSSMLFSPALVVASLLALEASAFAQNVPSEEKNERPKDHSVAVMISPLHLILPVVEITTELRLHENAGVAIIGGIGSMDPYRFSTPPPGIETGRFTVWELGGQLAVYPIGHFDHGVQLGAEVLYVGAAGSAESKTGSATGVGQGLSMGPFLGYKFTARAGFSLAIQGGVAYTTLRADVKDSSGNESSATGSGVGPLLNINLGWAF